MVSLSCSTNATGNDVFHFKYHGILVLVTSRICFVVREVRSIRLISSTQYKSNHRRRDYTQKNKLYSSVKTPDEESKIISSFTINNKTSY